MTVREEGYRAMFREKQEIRKLKKQSDTLSMVLHNRKDAASQNAYNACKNIYREKFVGTRREENLRKIENAAKKNKGVWKVIKKRSRFKKKVCTPEVDPKALNEYLINVEKKLIKSVPQVDVYPSEFQRNSIFLEETTSVDVLKIIKETQK